MNNRIPVATAVFTEAEAEAVYEAAKSGWVTMGPRVAAFEEAFARSAKAKHAISMCNGTATLHAILAALDIGPGDEVVVPTLTYIASSNAVLYQGADLRLCECDPLTYNIRVEDVEAVVTDRTRAIIAVDMNGLPVDYQPLVAFSNARGITLVADSAESLGALYRGAPIGAQAPVHSFSFFGNKNVTTGEGGMITTDDDKLADELRILRNQGQEGRYNHTRLGFNFRMTDLAAAIGLVQLESLFDRLEAKARIVATYNERFAGHDFIEVPVVPDYVDRHAWYMYTLSLDPSVDRDGVVVSLDKDGIDTRLSFPPVHIQPYYVERFGHERGDFPISMGAWQRLINLPISPDLNDSEIHRVVESTLAAVAANRAS